MTQLIELALNAEIVSVDGVVNGESYAFAMTGSADGMSIWSASVARADDDIYRVTVTAINHVGTSSQLSTVIYYGLHLITDRTQFDVDRVKEMRKRGWANLTPEERSEWESGLKGAYNNSDLNRVQSAIRYLADRFADVGYFIELSGSKSWTVQDIPTRTDLENYLSDVRAIRRALTLFKTTPNVPDTMLDFNYIKANHIEQILFDVDTLLSNMIASFVYSGEFFGGELR